MYVQVDAVNETVWMSQKGMAELFGVTVSNISYHLKKIFDDAELDASAVIKEILITAQSGARGVSEEKVRFYNLDAIIAVGYRVNSKRATAFRIWATKILREYLVKGFALDDGERPQGIQQEIATSVQILSLYRDGNGTIRYDTQQLSTQ